MSWRTIRSVATLSLCLMARDAEVEIARAIDSASPVADEVIVVDTGSKDQTRSVAAARGARVLEFPWGDDFAAVRNFLFAQARSEWIFHLDADEALLPESGGALRSVIERADVDAAYVLRQDLWDDDDPERFTEMAQLRLFRSEGLPSLVGRCHPLFEPPLEEVAARRGQIVAMTEVRIRHWGYVGGRTRDKRIRGARLLRLELAERPGRLYYLSELAQTLYDLEDREARQVLREAAHALDRELAAGHDPGTGGLVLLESMLGLPEEELPSSWPRSRIRREALARYSRHLPILWQIARLDFLAGDYRSAQDHLERIAEFAQRGDFDRWVSFNPDIVGDELWLNLGVCRLRRGDQQGAEASLRRVDPKGRFAAMAEESLAALRHPTPGVKR